MAYSTAQEIIVLKSPSLAGDLRIDDLVELAKLTVSQSTFGTSYQYALALVVLHQLTLDAQSGGSSTGSGSGVSGGIKAEWEGDLKKEFGVPSSSSGSVSDAYYGTTIFGQEYINLKRSVIFGPRTRNNSAPLPGFGFL